MSRYEVTVVQGDGVPYPVLETPDLTVAACKTLTTPKRGWLEWPEDQ